MAKAVTLATFDADFAQLGARVTSVSFQIKGDPPDYRTMTQIARRVGALNDASKWWIGDLCLYAEAVFGEKASQLAEEFGRSPDTLRKWAYVCERIPAVRRRTDLSFSVHSEVASLDPDSQSEWLDHARDGRWTVAELRENVRALKPAGRTPAARGPSAPAKSAADDPVEGVGDSGPLSLAEAVRAAVGGATSDGTFALVPMPLWLPLVDAACTLN